MSLIGRDPSTGWSGPTLALVGFALGAAATLAFQRGALAVLTALEWVEPAAAAHPHVTGLPGIVWAALGGGLWGALLAPVLVRAGDVLLWPVAVVAGAVVPTVASYLIVSAPAGEGLAGAGGDPHVLATLAVNAAWALGLAALLQLVRTVASIVLLIKGMP